MSTVLPPPLAAIPADIVTASDYERYAAERLPPDVLAFVEGGADGGLAMRRNAGAFDRVTLNSRVLARVSGGHTRTELFGRTYAHPFLLAPVGYQRLVHPAGELAAARAASAFEAGMVVSTLSSVAVEEIAAVAPGAPLWFQLYLRRDRAFTESLVRRAEAAGCEAIVVTVDSLFAGVRLSARRAGFRRPDDISCVHLRDEPLLPKIDLDAGQSLILDGVMGVTPTWADIAWLRTRTRLPLLLKGVMSPEDAYIALDHGVDGLVVSNHGGRVFDSAPATLDALPRIAEKIGGAVPLILDGGIHRGSDAFKAIALGASAVMIGRAYIRALAAAGPLGVAHVLKMLREELEGTMAQTGCRTLADIGPGAIFRP